MLLNETRGIILRLNSEGCEGIHEYDRINIASRLELLRLEAERMEGGK
jgi:hypothetical protein